jgi:MoxR-like ATPase
MNKEKINESLRNLDQKLKTVILGKPDQIELTLTCLLADGHLLLEDLPGVGKTTLASALSQAIGGTFNRIQFTADLLPSDILGTKIYRRSLEKFEFVKGPIFANIVLADELNRAPPKTQSALLQAMNEYEVSVDRNHFQLSLPFMVIATQNPRGFHGTYPLPESQRDRFLMRLTIGYPDAQAEKDILQMKWGVRSEIKLKQVLELDEIRDCQKLANEIEVPEHVYEYITRLTQAVRSHEEVDLPVSPRGSIALMRAAQALAYLRGLQTVNIDIIKELVPFVWCHRIGLKGTTTFNSEGAPLEWVQHELLQKVKIE